MLWPRVDACHLSRDFAFFRMERVSEVLCGREKLGGWMDGWEGSTGGPSVLRRLSLAWTEAKRPTGFSCATLYFGGRGENDPVALGPSQGLGCIKFPPPAVESNPGPCRGGMASGSGVEGAERAWHSSVTGGEHSCFTGKS